MSDPEYDVDDGSATPPGVKKLKKTPAVSSENIKPQTTAGKIWTMISIGTQILGEVGQIPVGICLIVGAGFQFGNYPTPAAALWVAAYSLWVGHPLGLGISSIPPLFAIRTISTLIYFGFALAYFVSLVLLIIGASLYIGPAAGVDGTKNAGSVLFIIGSCFYLFAFVIRQMDIYYELVNIREKAELRRLDDAQRRVRETRKWGDGFQASIGLAIGVLLIIGSVGISGWMGRGGEIMGGVLWLIVGVLLFAQMAAGLMAIRPRGRMEVESERKRERVLVNERQSLSPKLERVDDDV